MLERVKSSKTFFGKLFPFVLLFLFISPILIYWVYFHLIRPVSPYFEQVDPEFAYLMNSLEVFKGHTYAFVDHPGTPVEILGTVFYAIIYPFLHLSRHGFVLYNLKHPGLFLNMAHAFLTLANIACVVFFAMPVKRLQNVLVGSAMATLYFALHSQSYFSTATWSHNSFAFPFGTPLLLLLYKSLTDERRPEISTRTLIVLGAGAGLLAAVTVYLAVWFVGILLAILISYRLRMLPWGRILRASGIIVLSGLGSFLVAIIPILSRAGQFSGFISGMLSHNNPYLIGVSKTPALVRMAANFASLYRELPTLVIFIAVLFILAACASTFWRKKLAGKAGLWGIIGGLSLQIVLLAAFLLDHYLARYFLAVAAIVPVLALAVVGMFENWQSLKRFLNGLLVLFVSIELIVSLNHQIESHNNFSNRVNRIQSQQRTALQKYAQNIGQAPGEPATVWAYSSYSPCVSLWFGNAYTDRVFNAEIEDICPDFYIYMIQDRGIYTILDKGEISKIEGPIPVRNMDWDIFFGCQGMTLNNPALNDRSKYVMQTPKPSTRVKCGRGDQISNFVIFTRK